MIASALLLGWGAARRRHLQPYEALYRERGLEVASELLDPLAARRGACMARDIERIAARVAALDGPLLVHMFSRVGFITYGALLESSEGRRLRARVAAHVFDSGPGVPLRLTPALYAAQMARGMLATSGQAARPRRLPELALCAALLVHYHLSPGVRRHYADARARHAAYAPVVPALCLYSPMDLVVDAHDVEAFAVHERERGAQVELCEFPRSAHVQHLRLHRARYRDAVDAFMGRVAAGPVEPHAPSQQHITSEESDCSDIHGIASSQDPVIITMGSNSIGSQSPPSKSTQNISAV